MSLDPIAGSAGLTQDQQEARLRRAARDLEGVFVAELFKAMRETVPQGGLVDGGSGEEMFTSMLDQHLAPQAGAGWGRGVGEALYRQLRGALAAQGNAEGGTE
jgi:peptidoglycan hydrolase FlgJ